jgi:hypothetical protein
VERRKQISTHQLAMEWGKAATLLLDRAAIASDQDWASHRIPWLGGDIPLRYLLQTRVVEWWIHGEDIRSGAGLDVRFIHNSIYLVNDLAIRMVPYALGLAGLVLRGLSVQVDLEGVGEGSWHYALAPGERPSSDKQPDAFIEGRGYRFALVAGRRDPAERYLEDGNLVVGGDEDLATAILENLRAFRPSPFGCRKPPAGQQTLRLAHPYYSRYRAAYASSRRNVGRPPSCARSRVARPAPPRSCTTATPQGSTDSEW